MKKCIAIILSILFVLALSACGETDKKGDQKADGTEQEAMTEIETPYAVLKIDQAFDEKVGHEVTNQDPYTLTFATKDDQTELFSLVFNAAGDVLLGTIVGEEENTIIYMNVAKLDKDSENYETNLTYQEGVNDILSGLLADYDFVPNEAIEKENDDTFDIETFVVTLQYPLKWKERVTIDITEDGVSFSDQGTPVFDVMFKEVEGNLLGFYKDVPVYIVEYPADSDDQLAMKEDVNVILQHLMENPDFVVG